MKIIYHENYNIDVGIFKFLHPFDGCKFSKVRAALNAADVIAPKSSIAEDAILSSLNELLKIQVKDKAALCRALEIPKIPFLSFSWLDSRILSPMRWGVAGTLTASHLALGGNDAWNLAGGYHHASPHRMEGFCIYNDIIWLRPYSNQQCQLKPHPHESLRLLDWQCYFFHNNYSNTPYRYWSTLPLHQKNH